MRKALVILFCIALILSLSVVSCSPDSIEGENDPPTVGTSKTENDSVQGESSDPVVAPVVNSTVDSAPVTVDNP